MIPTIAVVKVLEELGLLIYLSQLLSPAMGLIGLPESMGIEREATTITIVGMTLGLSFGGGLLIREAEVGHVSRRDIFASLTMLALCHSLIEDTLLVMLLGAHHSGILWMRIAFTLAVLAITLPSAVIRKIDAKHKNRSKFLAEAALKELG